jgi:hypothetical protein
LQQEIARSRKAEKAATLKSALLSFLCYFVFVSHVLTHLLAWISALVSLGVLLNSGFRPNKEFGFSAMIAFLLLSFSSIIWTLGFYGIFADNYGRGCEGTAFGNAVLSDPCSRGPRGSRE